MTTLQPDELPGYLLNCFPDATSYALLSGDPATAFLRIANGVIAGPPALNPYLPSLNHPERWARFQDIRLFGPGPHTFHLWRTPDGSWLAHQQMPLAEDATIARLYPLLGERDRQPTPDWTAYRDGRGAVIWVPAEHAVAPLLALQVLHNTSIRSTQGAQDPALLTPLTVVADALVVGFAPIS
jgi:hypothetical protein